MKKLMLAIIAVVSAAVMCFAMAACSSDVSGNTYVFDSISISYDSTVADSDKLSEADLAEIKKDYENMEVTFEKDGTYKVSGTFEQVSYYKQDGDTVCIYKTKADADENDNTKAIGKMTVNGSKLEASLTQRGATLKIIYKKK